MYNFFAFSKFISSSLHWRFDLSHIDKSLLVNSFLISNKIVALVNPIPTAHCRNSLIFIYILKFLRFFSDKFDQKYTYIHLYSNFYSVCLHGKTDNTYSICPWYISAPIATELENDFKAYYLFILLVFNNKKTYECGYINKLKFTLSCTTWRIIQIQIVLIKKKEIYAIRTHSSSTIIDWNGK